MKHILLSTCFLLVIGSVFPQSRVMDFASAMISAPVGKKISVTNVSYIGDGGTYEGVEERLVKFRKPSHSIRDEYVAMGRIIDSLNLIDYKADTIFIISHYYLPSGSVSKFFKVRTRNNPFYFTRDAAGYIKDATGNYILKYLDDQYDSHTDPQVIASDSLFYDTVYSWDIDKLIQMIKVSGGPEGAEYYMSASRILIQNEQVVKIEIVNFKPALFWLLQPLE